jgi:hypothetical protein
MKSEVYSWRVSVDLKTELEREAQRRKISVSAALDLAARDWLDKGGVEIESDQEQLRLRRGEVFWGSCERQSSSLGERTPSHPPTSATARWPLTLRWIPLLRAAENVAGISGLFVLEAPGGG